MERKKGWNKSRKEQLTFMWVTVKISKMCIIGGLEGQEKKNGTEATFELMMAENFLKLMKDQLTYPRCST